MVLYAGNKEAQHSYIEIAKDKGYEVLLLDSPIISHLIQKIEGDNKDLTFVRVDSDHIDNLIKKEENAISKLSDTEKESLKTSLETYIPKAYTVQLEALDSNAAPLYHHATGIYASYERNESIWWWRNVRNGKYAGNVQFGGKYQLRLGFQHFENRRQIGSENLVKQALDLAKFSQNLLKGEELTAFVKRSFDLIK